MPHSFVVYIDESGDDGFTFRDPPEQGSSKWLVLSAIVVSRAQDSAMPTFMDSVRAKLRLQPKTIVHFSSLQHATRVAWITMIAEAGYTACSIIISKAALIQDTFNVKGEPRLYFYAVRLLLERVSWYCRDYRPLPEGDRSARLIFENRTRTSYDDLRSYLRRLRQGIYTPDADDWTRFLLNEVRIDWNHINPEQVTPRTKSQCAGLQVADAVSSGIRYALELDRFGLTEHRYSKTLKPIIYCRGANYLSYGLKFFPQPPVAPAAAAHQIHWITKHYR